MLSRCCRSQGSHGPTVVESSMDGCMDVWMDGSMDAWMDGSMDGWMDESMDGWIFFFLLFSFLKRNILF